ncbi:MAG: hypothetical protein IT159_07005 [Bryobacterales bacterium]|nr:hypothetical protein [Bryobacterales bacterium]
MSGSEGSLAAAIRGPIMLIVAGALFALAQTTPYGIRSTWPVLLIALGLLKLMDRMGGPKPPQG